MMRVRGAVILVLLGMMISGCATFGKSTKQNPLEQENKKLQNQIAQLAKEKEDLKNELTTIRYEKDMQIEKLQAQLERNLEQLETKSNTKIQELEQAKRELEQTLQKELASYQAKMEMTQRGLVITFLDEILFDSGKAHIRAQGVSVLEKVAAVLTNEVPSNPVMVEGHTDNVPIKYSGWESNWELSCARAIAVVQYFTDIKGLLPVRFAATGYGEYHPVMANDTPQGRQQNRRVEIVILPEKIEKVKAH